MLRNIASVIVGYAIFVVSSVALFKVSGINPHADPAMWFAVLTVAYGTAFSFLSGVTTRAIAKTNGLAANYVLAIILAGFALFSLLKTTGNHWTQLLAIFVFAPASVLGGWFYRKRFAKS